MVLWLSRWLFRFFFRGLLRTRVYGLENIPRSGAVILAINHASYLDGPLVGSEVAAIRPFRSLGKRELFEVPLLGAYMRAVGTIPIDRDRPDVPALRQVLGVLERGELLILAPEGTRGASARPKVPQAGVGFLARRSGAPVIPVRIHGTGGWPRPGGLWLRFGAPVRFPEEPAARRDAEGEFAVRLLETVYAMREP